MLVQLLEAPLKLIVRKVHYGFSCDSQDLFGLMKSSPTWENFHAGKEKNRTMRNQVNVEGVTKRWPVVLQVPLGQKQSDVQGRCRVATANSSYAKTQDDYDGLNRVNDQGSPRSGFCLRLHLQGWIPCEQIHVNKKKSSGITFRFGSGFA